MYIRTYKHVSLFSSPRLSSPPLVPTTRLSSNVLTSVILAVLGGSAECGVRISWRSSSVKATASAHCTFPSPSSVTDKPSASPQLRVVRSVHVTLFPLHTTHITRQMVSLPVVWRAAPYFLSTTIIAPIFVVDRKYVGDSTR